MASPFAVFRRNRKAMMVALTVMVMFGFVFIPILMDALGNRAARDEVIVSTKRYGNLKASDIQRMLANRNRLIGIMREIRNTVSVGGGNLVPVSDVLGHMGHMNDESEQGITPEAVVTTWVQARYAEELGMVVSDKAINDFLKEVTDGHVTAYHLEEILKRYNTSETDLFRLLREELLSLRLFETSRTFALEVMEIGGGRRAAVPVVTPGQRWDYFQRIRRQAEIELIAVPVRNYTDQVQEPDEATLKAFFEEHRDKLWPPYSPTPGFKQPSRAKMHYLKADLDKVAELLVTDEEVLKEYEEKRDQYDRALGAMPAEPDKPAEPSQEGDKPAEPKEEPKAEPKEEPKAEPKEEPKPEESSSNTPWGPFRLVAMQDEKPSDENAKADEPKESMQENQPSGDTPKADEPKPAPPADVPEAPAVPAAPQLSLPAVPAVPGAQSGPSEQTRQLIRRTLAMQKIDAAFDLVSGRLTKYRESKIGAKRKDAPPPDFSDVARQYHLTDIETDLLPQWGLDELELAQAYPDTGGAFMQTVFGQRTFVPVRGQDAIGGRRYIWWTTEEVKEHTPKWSEAGVRERVLEAWKAVEARALARKAAEQLADEARKAGKPLKEAFAGRADLNVVDPEAFSWMSSGSVPSFFSAALEISRVEHVDTPGHEFMRTVFDLSEGGVGTAMNQPETFAYVVRAVAFSPPMNTLWESFTTRDFREYMQLAIRDSYAMLYDWQRQLEKAAGLKWERKFEGAAEEQ